MLHTYLIFTLAVQSVFSESNIFDYNDFTQLRAFLKDGKYDHVIEKMVSNQKSVDTENITLMYHDLYAQILNLLKENRNLTGVLNIQPYNDHLGFNKPVPAHFLYKEGKPKPH